MRKFKHKLTGDVAELEFDTRYYLIKDKAHIPSRLIENSNDWEEVREEFPKIISFRSLYEQHYNVILEYDGEKCINRSDGENPKTTISYSTALVDPKCEIYQVAVSETEVFTLGDKVEIIMNRPKYSKSIISRFELEANGFISVRVSKYCSVSLNDIKKAPEVLFVTEDGVERYVNEDFYYIGDAWNLYITKCLYKGDGDFSRFKTFHNREAAKKYIDENKPIYSKKQVKEALEESYFRESYILDVPYCCADKFRENIFKQKLGL